MRGRPELSRIQAIYRSVPAYRNMVEELKINIEKIKAFDEFPIMQKSRLIEAQSSCIMPEFLPKYLMRNLIRERTSGSTGQYLEIFWDNADYIKSMVELWILRVKFYGIYPHNRLCFFFTENGMEQGYIEQKNEFGICKTLLTEKQLAQVYEDILEWDPEWMILQPSVAVILCEHIRRNKLRVPSSLRYIEFNGEILTDEVRNMTRMVFGCKIANQYGANEVNSIGFECQYGNMHILNSNVFVEIVDEEGCLMTDSSDFAANNSEEGRIILTSRRNNAMPFVRYEIGDKGKIHPTMDCPCGCKGKIIELSTGRNNDYVLFADGGRASSYIFVGLLDMVNVYTDGAIIQFYVEQLAYDEFRIMIYKDEEVEENYIIAAFQSCMKEERLLYAKFHFEFTDSLFEVRGSGKHMYYRNSMG